MIAQIREFLSRITAMALLWLRITLVEPGGYLQCLVHSSATGVSKHSSDQVIEAWRSVTEDSGLKLE